MRVFILTLSIAMIVLALSLSARRQFDPDTDTMRSIINNQKETIDIQAKVIAMQKETIENYKLLMNNAKRERYTDPPTDDEGPRYHLFHGGMGYI